MRVDGHNGPVRYQDVGVNIALEAKILPSGKIQAWGEIESSMEALHRRNGQRDSATHPTIETFSHNFASLFESGQEQVMADLSTPLSGNLTFSIAARVEG